DLLDRTGIDFSYLRVVDETLKRRQDQIENYLLGLLVDDFPSTRLNRILARRLEPVFRSEKYLKAAATRAFSGQLSYSQALDVTDHLHQQLLDSFPEMQEKVQAPRAPNPPPETAGAAPSGPQFQFEKMWSSIDGVIEQLKFNNVSTDTYHAL